MVYAPPRPKRRVRQQPTQAQEDLPRRRGNAHKMASVAAAAIRAGKAQAR